MIDLAYIRPAGEYHAQARATRARCKVMAALRRHARSLDVRQIAAASGLSVHQVRRALESLCAMRAVAASGPGNHRRYALMVCGGYGTGGQASESAAGAAANIPSTPAARPGSAA